MINPALEHRLRREMSSSTGEPPPDPAVLARIRQRAAINSEAPSHQATPQPRDQRYGRLVLVAGLAATVVAAVALAIGGAPDRLSMVQPAADGPPPAALPGPPSWWWMVAVIAAGALATAYTWRRGSSRLAAVGIAVLAAGLAMTVAVTLPNLRTGARLVADAPTLDGYRLSAADLQTRSESLPPRRLATLRYEPLPTVPAPADLTVRDMIGPELRGLGFEHPFPGLGARCRSDTPPRQGGPLPTGDYYCLISIDDGSLEVAATVYQTGRAGWPQWTGLPVAWLGVILLVQSTLVTTDGTVRRRLRREIRYGTALALVSLALFLMVRVAVDLVTVGSFAFARDCVLGDSAWPACRDRIDAVIHNRQVRGPADRLYGDVVMLIDVVAAGLVALAWTAAPLPLRPIGGRAPDGKVERSRARWWILVVLSVGVVVVGVGFQVAFGERLSVLTDYNE